MNSICCLYSEKFYACQNYGAYDCGQSSLYSYSEEEEKILGSLLNVGAILYVLMSDENLIIKNLEKKK